MKIKSCSSGFRQILAETDGGDLIVLDGQSCLEIMYALLEMVQYPNYEDFVDGVDNYVRKNNR